MPQTYQSIQVNAPLDQVWSKLTDFHSIPWKSDIITKCQKVGNTSGNQVGAKRVLNDAIYETLLELNPTSHLLRYSVDDGPSPVSPAEISNYVGTVHLVPNTMENKTLIEWSSTWEGESEEPVTFCRNIYNGLLKEMANYFDK